jgi:hypothetical protein
MDMVVGFDIERLEERKCFFELGVFIVNQGNGHVLS